MAFTEQDALALTHNIDNIDLDEGEEADLISRIMLAYHKGLNDGISKTAREMYWTGVKAGMLRYAYVSADGIFVGYHETTKLADALKALEDEERGHNEQQTIPW